MSREQEWRVARGAIPAGDAPSEEVVRELRERRAAKDHRWRVVKYMALTIMYVSAFAFGYFVTGPWIFGD
jgi:hypothetical protein